jgi:superfamily I DNA/RNA helicase
MTPSKNQIAIYKAFNLTQRDLNISAVAGSGKTTTLLELLKFIPVDESSLFLAFNNSIVDELKKRNTRRDVFISTIHSCGWRAILMRYGSKVKMTPAKALIKTEKALARYEIDERKRGWFLYAIPQIIDLMRCNLLPPEPESVEWIGERYDLNIEDIEKKMAVEVFEAMNRDRSCFDFMDMVYQPVYDSSIRMRKYDYVFCDEAQDFSICQQEFIRKCINRRGRLITVGDPRQAIYGFAGADENSYEKLADLNGKAIRLPLSISYRCSKNVVREAQQIVPQISYSPTAEDGEVKWGSLKEIKDGDWILCRNLKPLVEAYIWLIKNKIKCKIRGKEIGEGILALINKVGGSTVDGLLKNLEREQERLIEKLSKKGIKEPEKHPKMETLLQKIEVIECLAEEVETIKGLRTLIQSIFSDEVRGILLSTIHKAKGLENDKIFFICPELIPSRFATQEWQIKQEKNLFYVAITRAKRDLTYVSKVTFDQEIKTKIECNHGKY